MNEREKTLKFRAEALERDRVRKLKLESTSGAMRDALRAKHAADCVCNVCGDCPDCDNGTRGPAGTYCQRCHRTQRP